jgi:hypothetical protein
MKRTSTKTSKTSDRTAYRMKPGKPSPKTSQSGYGHKPVEGASVKSQGPRRDTVKR